MKTTRERLQRVRNRNLRSLATSATVSSRPLSTREKVKHYLRVFIAFLFSHIGITALVVFYVVSGAFLFQAIERTAEDRLVIKVESLIKSTTDKMWQVTSDVNVLNRSKWELLMVNATDIFTNQLMNHINDGYDDKPRQEKWTFPGAFLFCLTVITLIGMYVSFANLMLI